MTLSTSRYIINDLYPLNDLNDNQAEELCTLIDRNFKEGVLKGKDRERFDQLIHEAEKSRKATN